MNTLKWLILAFVLLATAGALVGVVGTALGLSKIVTFSVASVVVVVLGRMVFEI